MMVMSDDQTSAGAPLDQGRDDRMTALFANMVSQQTSMTMMLLGQTPHPETGKIFHDLDAARLFIDQLEMIEAKTKGNLSKEESAFLKQNLMSLRLAFVQAVEKPPAAETSAAPKPSEATPPSEPAVAAPTPPSEEEQRKKFSKKY
jgi:hypothetical protein